MVKLSFKLFFILLIASVKVLAQDSLQTAVKNKLLKDKYAFDTYLLLGNCYSLSIETSGLTDLWSFYSTFFNMVNPFCRFVKYNQLCSHFKEIYSDTSIEICLGDTKCNKQFVKRMLLKKTFKVKKMKNPWYHYKRFIQKLKIGTNIYSDEENMIHYLLTDTIPTPLIDK